jgi:hypothetical protein
VFEMIFLLTLLSVAALVVLVGFLIWKFHDVIVYLLEVLAYLLRALWALLIQFAAELIGVADEWCGDAEIADNPLLRLAVMGAFGLLLGLGLILLLAMVLGQPWVLIILALSVALCMVLGLLADPERDLSLPAFPRFTQGGGPKLPLNL